MSQVRLTVSHLAARILCYLRSVGGSATRAEISILALAKNYRSADIQAALDQLLHAGQVRCVRTRTKRSGRPPTRIELIGDPVVLPARFEPTAPAPAPSVLVAIVPLPAGLRLPEWHAELELTKAAGR